MDDTKLMTIVNASNDLYRAISQSKTPEKLSYDIKIPVERSGELHQSVVGRVRGYSRIARRWERTPSPQRYLMVYRSPHIYKISTQPYFSNNSKVGTYKRTT